MHIHRLVLRDQHIGIYFPLSFGEGLILPESVVRNTKGFNRQNAPDTSALGLVSAFLCQLLSAAALAHAYRKVQEGAYSTVDKGTSRGGHKKCLSSLC